MEVIDIEILQTKMNLQILSTALNLHLSPTPLHSIIFQYSLPSSLNSYGISFDRVLSGKITIRMYFRLSIKSGRSREGSREVPLLNMLLSNIDRAMK